MRGPSLAGLALAIGTLASAAIAAEPTGNSGKAQKDLERIAAAIRGQTYGLARVRDVAVGDHLLAVKLEPKPGADAELALKKAREESWDRGVCSNRAALDFINREGITIRFTFALPGQPDQPIADVTARSCAREATVDPEIAQVIGGVAFAPKPTREQALAKVQAYITEHFFDPDAAQVKCGNVGPPAWIKPTLDRRRYGYFLSCSINGKNRLGGYVGYSTYVFRFNGDQFEQVTETSGSEGLMEANK